VGTRKKVLTRNKISEVHFCDICLTDKKTLLRCKACSKEYCSNCRGAIGFCKDCAGPCKGCGEYTVQQLIAKGHSFCPNCGYVIKKK